MDAVRQIVFTPLGGGADRGSLEIFFESGQKHQREVPAQSFMHVIADLMRIENAKGNPGENIPPPAPPKEEDLKHAGGS